MPARRRKPNTLIGDAWEEFVTTKQLATGNGEMYVPQLAEVPGWFPAIELGMSFEHGPSIAATRSTLDIDNRERSRQHREHERLNPERKTLARAKRMSPEESRRALRSILRQHGVTIRQGNIVVSA